jgi:hypothetical protein
VVGQGLHEEVIFHRRPKGSEVMSPVNASEEGRAFQLERKREGTE